MLRTSLIIPTYHRPGELSECLRSVLEQTHPPDELIIIDDGCLEGVPHGEEFARRSIPVRYHRKDTPGLTASRNLGIDLASGDLLFFLDDDVVLFPDYLERMLAVFVADGQGRVGGVGGRIVNTKPVTGGRLLLHWFERAFLLSGPVEGRVLASGFCVDYGECPQPLERQEEVDFLPGGVVAYRRQVCDRFRFSESYTGYGQGEDKDFSMRVGREFVLLSTPTAKLYHNESPKMRFDARAKGREYVLGRYRFFRDFQRPRGIPWPVFSYALAGYFLKRFIVLCAAGDQRREWRRLVGMAEAVRSIIKGEHP
ncbi:MAG: glycosyltransferase [Thermodesulfobacteriota bacterium]